MTVLVSNNGTNQQERSAQRSARMFLILTFSIFGIAVAYFGALYLIAH
jgi:hypothetical protein